MMRHLSRRHGGRGNTVDLSSEDVNDARSELTPRPPLLQREGEARAPFSLQEKGVGGMSFLSQQYLGGGEVS